jgi:hypothetical protein
MLSSGPLFAQTTDASDWRADQKRFTRDAREAYEAPAVRGIFENRLARDRDPPHLGRIRTTDPALFCQRTRSPWIESRRHGAFDPRPVLRMAEAKPSASVGLRPSEIPRSWETSGDQCARSAVTP